jgi:hypothetical protein
MAAQAHPLTLTRICNDCQGQTPDIITAGQAKAAFLLSNTDLDEIPQAELEDFGVIYLLSDVCALSKDKKPQTREACEIGATQSPPPGVPANPPGWLDARSQDGQRSSMP